MFTTRTDYCMNRILSLEEDFKAQKSQLQEEIEKEITVTIHYMVRFTKIVPKALDSIPLIYTIRKFAVFAHRHVDFFF